VRKGRKFRERDSDVEASRIVYAFHAVNLQNQVISTLIQLISDKTRVKSADSTPHLASTTASAFLKAVRIVFDVKAHRKSLVRWQHLVVHLCGSSMWYIYVVHLCGASMWCSLWCISGGSGCSSSTFEARLRRAPSHHAALLVPES
jgi:hypothetical protein